MAVQRRYKNGIWYLKMRGSIAEKRKENKVRRNSLPNGEEIGEAGAGGYKYLGVLEVDIIMCDKMERKVKEVYQKIVTLL